MVTVYEETRAIERTLRQSGCRITKERTVIVRTILQNPNSSCKELCYLVQHEDSTISHASVYRTVRLLESMGMVQRAGVSVCGLRR